MTRMNKRGLCCCLAAALAVFMLMMLCACGGGNTSDKTDNTEKPKLASVRLESLTLDDGNYFLDFNKEVFEYTVTLPDGRPPIPRVNATAAEGVTVEIFQCYIPDGETTGSARIIVTDGEGSNTYTVKFERNKNCGFVLQYDDRYEFRLSAEASNAKNIEFVSDNEEALSVTRSGLMHAKKVCQTPITVKATSGGEVVDTLVIDRIEKAHINLFLLTGQSSAQGCYSNTTMKDADLNAKQLAKVEKIGRDGIVYSYDYHPLSSNTEAYKIRQTLYDMNSIKKQGVQNSLGKTWYALSGEKVVFLHTAYSGAPIQSWLDLKRHDEAGRYTSSGYNFYEDTQKAYKRLMTLLGENYEIIRTANFWNQGGTAMVSVYDKRLSNYIGSGDAGFDASKLMTAEEYYRLFMLMHNDMKTDFGVEYVGIFLNRTMSGAASAESKALQQYSDLVPIRLAQYSLHNTLPEVSLVSRVGDFAKQTNWNNKNDYGYGFVDTDNTHYTQIGYNERGRVAAETAFEIWMVGPSAESVEIVGENGRDRLTSKDTLRLKVGDEYRLAAYALPAGSGEMASLTSSDPAVLTVDKYGIVKGVKAGKAVITATTQSGKSESVSFEVYEVTEQKVTYRWDFNDLKATGEANGLTLSEASKYYKAENYYSISGGVYTVKSTATKNTRPDFNLEIPVTLNSEADWMIEWRGKISSSCALLGPAHTSGFDGDVTANGYIYLAYAANFGSESSPLYPLRFVPETGAALSLSYGDKRLCNKEFNCWRLSYDAEANTMSLLLSEDEGKTWQTLSSVKAGTFETTFKSVCGRMRGNGYLNYNGSLDYLQIEYTAEKAK